MKRIDIKDTLDHPWFSSANSAISILRKEAVAENNETLKFISYSNVDINQANRAKLSQGNMSPSSPNRDFRMRD